MCCIICTAVNLQRLFCTMLFAIAAHSMNHLCVHTCHAPFSYPLEAPAEVIAPDLLSRAAEVSFRPPPCCHQFLQLCGDLHYYRVIATLQDNSVMPNNIITSLALPCLAERTPRPCTPWSWPAVQNCLPHVAGSPPARSLRDIAYLMPCLRLRMHILALGWHGRPSRRRAGVHDGRC